MRIDSGMGAFLYREGISAYHYKAMQTQQFPTAISRAVNEAAGRYRFIGAGILVVPAYRTLSLFKYVPVP